MPYPSASLIQQRCNLGQLLGTSWTRSTRTRVYFTRSDVQEPRWWAQEKPWQQRPGKGHAQPVHSGDPCELPGPRPHLGESQREPGPSLQKSCSKLTPKKGHNTHPCLPQRGQTPSRAGSQADGSWIGRGGAEIACVDSHVLPAVGDDHLLLWLPVLAALGLCGDRGGRGWEVRSGSGTPSPGARPRLSRSSPPREPPRPPSSSPTGLRTQGPGSRPPQSAAGHPGLP